MGAAVEINLRDVQPERLREAMLAVLQKQTATMPSASLDESRLLGRLPPAERVVSGAESSSEEQDGEGEEAVYFQSLLELGYLVASADGLDEREREMLALLVERITESRVDRERLLLHFADLDQTSDWLGRPERLIRMAANFEDLLSREEALSFAALVALADGELTDAEMQVLLELGKHLSLSETAVRETAHRVVASIKRELET
jgi:DNA-binding CsgD family transcriptional regulator